MPDDSVPPETPKPKRRGLAALLGFVRIGAPKPANTGPGAEIIDQAEAFQSLTVGDVMTPRADIVGADISSSFAEMVALFAETEHSRLPVYRDTLDDPVGVVHMKDLFKLLADPGRTPASGEPILHRLKREPLYVPPSMRAANLLLKMQAARTHMALVIDEFGGVDGLVTLEDVIESVVGQIDDEHDETAVVQVIARPGGIFEADARAALEDLEEAMQLSLMTPDLEEEEIDTIGGLVTALAGRVPQRGEVIRHPAGFEIDVTDADPRRVKRVRIRPAPVIAPPGEPVD